MCFPCAVKNSAKMPLWFRSTQCENIFPSVLGILLPLTWWKEKNDALPGLRTVHEGREGAETAASRRSILLCFRVWAEVLGTEAFQGHQHCQGTHPLPCWAPLLPMQQQFGNFGAFRLASLSGSAPLIHVIFLRCTFPSCQHGFLSPHCNLNCIVS